ASNIYIADEGTNLIYSVPIATGGAVTIAASPGGANNAFVDPQDVDIDSNGNIYIIGVNPLGQFNLFKHTSAGAFSAMVNVEGSVSAPGYLTGLTIDGVDNIYVTFTGDEGPPLKDAYIKKYDINLVAGTPAEFGTFGSGNDQFKTPLGLAAYYDSISSNSYVFVADSKNSRIQKIKDDGTVFSYDSTIQEDKNNILSPNDVAVDSAGNVYVVCEQVNTVKVYNASGVYQYKIGSYGTASGFIKS
ncbi:unnamed protein product, partial [marine sediment metagenome]